MLKILFYGSSSNGIAQGSTALEYAQDTRIRPSANPESPSGRPDYLGVDEVDIAEFDIAEEYCAKEPSLRGCSPYFNELAEMIMEDEGLEIPNTVKEAQDLYIALLGLIDNL